MAATVTTIPRSSRAPALSLGACSISFPHHDRVLAVEGIYWLTCRHVQTWSASHHISVMDCSYFAVSWSVASPRPTRVRAPVTDTPSSGSRWLSDREERPHRRQWPALVAKADRDMAGMESGLNAVGVVQRHPRVSSPKHRLPTWFWRRSMPGSFWRPPGSGPDWASNITRNPFSLSRKAPRRSPYRNPPSSIITR